MCKIVGNSGSHYVYNNGGCLCVSKHKRRKLMSKRQLVARLKQITALFEEVDRIGINLQGKDKKKRI